MPTSSAWGTVHPLAGPAGSYVAGLDPIRLGQLRERCRSLIPVAPFVVTAWAWAARGLVP